MMSAQPPPPADSVVIPTSLRKPTNPGWLRTQMPAVLAVLVFAAVAAWGYRTEWKFTNPFAPIAEEEKVADEGHDAEVTPGPKASVESSCSLDRTRIKLKSADIAPRMGLKTASVERRPLRATVTAPAELDYDQTRLTRLSSRVQGAVVRVEKEAGNSVRAGEVVALIDAAEVGKAKADLMQAVTQLDLKQQALDSLKVVADAVAGKQLREAESAAREARVSVQAARQALINLGLPVDVDEYRRLPVDKQDQYLRFVGLTKEYVKSLDPENTSSNLFPIVAPFDGVVVERSAVVGEVVDAAKILFQVADLTRVWVLADVRTDDADQIALGQGVTFEADGHPGEPLIGKISWTSTTVDLKTRTLRVRAVVKNPMLHWRAHTFGTARIDLRNEQDPVIAVPLDAVQRDGKCQYVFVRVDVTTFEARAVRLGVRGETESRNQPWVEILAGVEQGDLVATTGAFALKSEILKDRIGGDD